MVNPSDVSVPPQQARSHSHHNFGVRFGKRRMEIKQNYEPKGILELEALADRTYQLSLKYTSKPELSKEKILELLRYQHNLNFVLLCEKCHGPHRHKHDELIAPDR